MKKLKLSQILAHEKNIKNHGYSDFTKIHHLFQKTEPISGISKTYKPLKEDGEKFPDESNQIQVNVKSLLKEAQNKLIELLDNTAAKDFANCHAKANIIIDADTDKPIVLANDVPVIYLLWLDKQLNDLFTFVKNLPTLPASEQWTWDEAQNCYATKEFVTTRSKKIAKVLVKYPATTEHPAQTEIFHEDELIGNWYTTKFSSALKASEVEDFKTKVQKLQKAVKYAREEANSIEVDNIKIGEKILGFIFNP